MEGRVFTAQSPNQVTQGAFADKFGLYYIQVEDGGIEEYRRIAMR